MKWEKVELGTVFSRIKNGKSIKQFNDKKGYGITRIETISKYEVNRNKLGYANIINLAKYKDYILQDDDILMSHINSLVHLGKSAVYKKQKDENIIHGMNLLCLRTLNNKILPKYAFYYFNSPFFKANVVQISNQSVNQCSFSVSKLKNLKIPLPPLPIQKQIADLLDTADALRRTTAEQLQQLDDLAESVFLEMFGDPVLNEKGWEKTKLKALGDISSGSTPSRKIKSYWNGDISWVKTGEVNGKTILNTSEKITELGLKNSSCKIYPKGSILVAMYGQGKTRGKVGILGIEATTNQACGVIKLTNKKVNTNFVLEYLKQSYNSLRELGRGGNQPNLNIGMIKNFEINLPPLHLQNEFAKIIQNIESQKAELKKALQDSEDLFNSLLQTIFS